MRVTTQMLNESARRAGLPINHSSLLDHIGGNGKNALLDALNKKNSTVIDTENKKKYEKLGKTAEKLVNSSDALLQEGEKGIFAQVKESEDKQKLYDSIKTLFVDYNSSIKALKDTAGTMNDFYRQMLIETPEDAKEELAKVGVSFAKDGTASVDMDKLKSADGAKSVPLTKADAEAIAKAAQEGDFTAAEFGITAGAAISGSYIAKQAMKSGATAGIIEAAIALGPEIYEIIKYGIENGELDEEQLKTAGVDGLSAAGDGFLKGSISNALVVMCQAGKFGAEYVTPSPELIGATTVLVIDAIHYGIKTANGKMSTGEYIDMLVQEVAVSAGSLGSAALVSLLFPHAALAIMIGSFIGGLVVSAGYTTGKTYVLALIDSADVDILVPVESTAEAIKDVAESASIKVKDAVSGMKNIGTKVAKNVTIKVYDLKGAI